jgi:hypothetical protein
VAATPVAITVEVKIVRICYLLVWARPGLACPGWQRHQTSGNDLPLVGKEERTGDPREGARPRASRYGDGPQQFSRLLGNIDDTAETDALFNRAIAISHRLKSIRPGTSRYPALVQSPRISYSTIDATRPAGRDYAERLVISGEQRTRARSLLEMAGVKI